MQPPSLAIPPPPSRWDDDINVLSTQTGLGQQPLHSTADDHPALGSGSIEVGDRTMVAAVPGQHGRRR